MCWRGIYVCKKYAVANHFLQTYIPLFLYSQYLGWRRKEYAAANCFYRHISPFFDLAMQSVLRYVSQGELCCRKLFLQTYPTFFQCNQYWDWYHIGDDATSFF